MKGLTTGIVTALFLLAFAGLAHSGSVTGQLHIEATVPPTLEFRIVDEKHDLKITKSDADKGYKNVNNGTIISVTTNNSNGYVISVSANPLVSTEDKKDKDGEDRVFEVYTYVTVMVDGRSFGVAPGGNVDINMPATSKTNDTKRLSYKFTLSPGAGAGTYPWPIVVAVYPI